MEQTVDIENHSGNPARIRLSLIGDGVWFRLFEHDAGRWRFVTRYLPYPNIPEEEDAASAVSGAVSIEKDGTWLDIRIGDRRVGRCSSLTVGMHLAAMARHAARRS